MTRKPFEWAPYNPRFHRLDYGLPKRNFTPFEKMTDEEKDDEMYRQSMMEMRKAELENFPPEPVLPMFQCCEKAKVNPCVCYASWDCPEHGVQHIGTHD